MANSGDIAVETDSGDQYLNLEQVEFIKNNVSNMKLWTKGFILTPLIVGHLHVFSPGRSSVIFAILTMLVSLTLYPALLGTNTSVVNTGNSQTKLTDTDSLISEFDETSLDTIFIQGSKETIAKQYEYQYLFINQNIVSIEWGNSTYGVWELFTIFVPLLGTAAMVSLNMVENALALSIIVYGLFLIFVWVIILYIFSKDVTQTMIVSFRNGKKEEFLISESDGQKIVSQF
jgi:hypothetical protein